MATQWLDSYMTQAGDCIPGTAAFADWLGVNIEAVEDGTAWNGITLVGDGTSTIQEIVDAWNAANPTLPIQVDEGDASQIPTDKDEVTLAGGADLKCDDFFNTKEDAEVLKGLFIGRRAHQQHADLHNIKQLKMFDIL